MKKITLLIICLCILLVVLSGCSAQYKRINFDGYPLERILVEHIDEDTKVVNTASETFSDRFPVYKISERKISDREFRQMLEQLGLENNGDIRLYGNVINGRIKSVNHTDIDDFNMSDEELDKLAWETFNKLPFIEGTYEYCGITRTDTISDSIGTHVVSVGVSFSRTLDGIPIIGCDQCDLYFDNTGLVEIFVRVYDYRKIGTMDLVTLESASSKIKNPDALTIDEDAAQSPRIFDTLHVERNELVYYNQYNFGCTIVQPAYWFVGTATDTDGKQAGFKSIVIAIPDSYTYEGE